MPAPNEPTPLGLISEEVDDFSDHMKRKLTAKRSYGYWAGREITFQFLFKRLLDELHELYDALSLVENGNSLDAVVSSDVRDEAIDVANFAMFIFTLAGKRSEGI